MKGILIKTNRFLLKGIDKSYNNGVVTYIIPSRLPMYFIKRELKRDGVKEIILSDNFISEKEKLSADFNIVKKEDIYKSCLDKIMLKYSDFKGINSLKVGIMTGKDSPLSPEPLKRLSDRIKYVHIITANKDKCGGIYDDFFEETGISVMVSPNVKQERFNILIVDTPLKVGIKSNLVINLFDNKGIVYPNQLKEIITDIPKNYIDSGIRPEEYSYITGDFSKITGLII